MSKCFKNIVVMALLLSFGVAFGGGFIGNRQLRFGHNFSSNVILGLPETATSNLPTGAAYEGSIVYDSTTSTIKFYDASTWTALASGVTTIAACTDITITSAADGHLLVYQNGTSDWRNKAMSGDITISAAGVTTIGAGKIVNADVNASAVIAWSKMAALTDAHVLVGNGSNVATDVAVSGDVTLANTGATTVTDLTISSEAAGSMLRFDGSNWVHIAAGSANQYLEGGTTPAWTTPSVGTAALLANTVTCEAGTNDYTLDFGALSSSAADICMPDLAGTNDTLAFLGKAQTFSGNQTIKYGKLYLGDNDNGQTLQLLVNENLTGDKTLTYQPNDGSRTIDLSGNLVLGGNLTTTGAWTQSGAHTIGITTQANGTFAFADASAWALTFPTGTVTLASLTGAETFTNKTLTTPIIVTTGYIADADGDEYLVFTEDATPVNYVGITSGDAGVAPIVSVAGTDVNIDIELAPKGSGNVTGGTGSAAGVFESKGDNDVKLQTGNSTTGDITITDGANGDIDVTPNGTGQFTSTALSYTVTTETGNATLTVAEGGIILANSSGGAFTLTLPAAATSSGLWYTVKFIDSGTNIVTLDGNAAETIDGAGTNTELDAQYDYITIVCDGSNWHIIAEEWH